MKDHNYNVKPVYSQNPVFMSFRPLSSVNTFHSSKEADNSAYFGEQSILKSQKRTNNIYNDKQNKIYFRHKIIPNESSKEHMQPYLTTSITNLNQFLLQTQDQNQTIDFSKTTANINWQAQNRSNQHSVKTVKRSENVNSRAALNPFSQNCKITESVNQMIATGYLTNDSKNSKNTSFASVNSFASFNSFGKSPIKRTQNTSVCLQSEKQILNQPQRNFQKYRQIINKNSYLRSKINTIVQQSNIRTISNEISPRNSSNQNLILNNMSINQQTRKKTKAQQSQPQINFNRQSMGIDRANFALQPNRKLRQCKSAEFFYKQKIGYDYEVKNADTFQYESENNHHMLLLDNFESVIQRQQTESCNNQRLDTRSRTQKSEKQNSIVNKYQNGFKETVTSYTDYYNSRYLQLSQKYMKALQMIKEKDITIDQLNLLAESHQNRQTLQKGFKRSATTVNLHESQQNQKFSQSKELFNQINYLKEQNNALKNQLHKERSQKELLQTKIINIELKVDKIIDKCKKQTMLSCLNIINQEKNRQNIERTQSINFFIQ